MYKKFEIYTTKQSNYTSLLHLQKGPYVLPTCLAKTAVSDNQSL